MDTRESYPAGDSGDAGVTGGMAGDGYIETYSSASGDQYTSDYDGSSGTSIGQGGFRVREEMADQAQAKTEQVIDRAQETASQLKDQAQQQAQSMMTIQKERAADGLGSVAQAIRQTGQGLRDQGQQPQIADYAEKAAEQVEHFSGFLRERDLNEITYELERFARRQPAVFLGGAFLLGVIGARFLRSSSQRAQQMERYERYQQYGGSYPDTGTNYAGGRSAYGASGYSAARDFDTGYQGGTGSGYSSDTEGGHYTTNTGYDGPTGRMGGGYDTGTGTGSVSGSGDDSLGG